MGTEMGAPSNPGSPSPTQAGNPEEKARLEQMEKRNQELEKAVEGLKKDLIETRQHLKQVQQPPVPAGNPAADPVDQLLRAKFEEYSKPYKQALMDVQMARAYDYIGAKENLDPTEVPNSTVFKEIDDTARKYGIQKASPLEGAKAAYDLWKRDKKAEAEAKALAEAERLKAINNNGATTSTVGNVPTGTITRITESELAAMRTDDPRTAETIQAIKAGRIQLVRA